MSIVGQLDNVWVLQLPLSYQTKYIMTTQTIWITPINKFTMGLREQAKATLEFSSTWLVIY
jgi:hypothetical protein